MFSDVIRLVLRLMLFLSPGAVLVISFAILDPFNVIYRFNSETDYDVVTSYDYVTTENYLLNTKSINYNSFVFSNSVAMGYFVSDWCQYLDECEPYKFNSPGESIYNMLSKVKLIHDHGDTIKNAIIILDNNVISNFKNSSVYHQGVAYYHHPLTSSTSWFSFYFKFFKSYLADWFFIKYIDYRIFKKYRPYMSGTISDNSKPIGVSYKPRSNEIYYHGLEELIQADSAAYFSSKFKALRSFKLPEKYVFHPQQVTYLRDIHYNFVLNNTNYKIIISPAYNQYRIPEENIETLRDIFGVENVIDLSGVNEITNDPSHYYESVHYRPKAGKKILAKVYESTP